MHDNSHDDGHCSGGAGRLAYGEIEGRRQVRDTFEFIRSVTPGFERAYIAGIAPQIGIRETRLGRLLRDGTGRGNRARLKKNPRSFDLGPVACARRAR
jgi:hypothetical protein